jgi:hypothetical protein
MYSKKNIVSKKVFSEEAPSSSSRKPSYGINFFLPFSNFFGKSSKISQIQDERNNNRKQAHMNYGLTENPQRKILKSQKNRIESSYSETERNRNSNKSLALGSAQAKVNPVLGNSSDPSTEEIKYSEINRIHEQLKNKAAPPDQSKRTSLHTLPVIVKEKEKEVASTPATCDKCDGKHPTDNCPYFKKQRDAHPDAQRKSAKQIGGSSLLPGSYLLSARVVRQPGMFFLLLS